MVYYPLGPCGGCEGGARDMEANDGNRILKVQLRHGEAIDAIRIMYRCNGRDLWTDWWGGNGGQFFEFNLGEDEYLTCVNGFYGKFDGFTVVKSLTFVSNKHTHGPYGTEDGTAFNLTAPAKIVAFTARSAIYLDAIGVYALH